MGSAPCPVGHGALFLCTIQQQGVELHPQPLLLPQPQPQPLELPLPQQHHRTISTMMIQQQLPPPKPLLHIPEPPKIS